MITEIKKTIDDLNAEMQDKTIKKASEYLALQNVKMYADNIKNEFNKLVKKDSTNKQLTSFSFFIAISRINMLIRTNADDNTFRLKNQLCADFYTLTNQYIISADYDEFMRYVTIKLQKKYYARLLNNKSKQVKSLYNYDIINTYINEYVLARQTACTTDITLSTVVDLTNEVYIFLCNKLQKEQIHHLINLLCYDNKHNNSYTQTRAYLERLKTYVTVNQYNTSKCYIDNVKHHIYSLNADGQRHIIININDADTVRVTAKHIYVKKQHYIYYDLLTYVSKSINSNKRVKAKTDNYANFTSTERAVDDSGYIDLMLTLQDFKQYLIDNTSFNRDKIYTIVKVLALKSTEYINTDIANKLKISIGQVSKLHAIGKQHLLDYLQLNR